MTIAGKYKCDMIYTSTMQVGLPSWSYRNLTMFASKQFCGWNNGLLRDAMEDAMRADWTTLLQYTAVWNATGLNNTSTTYMHDLTLIKLCAYTKRLGRSLRCKSDKNKSDLMIAVDDHVHGPYDDDD